MKTFLIFDDIALAVLAGVMARPNSEGVKEHILVREAMMVAEEMDKALTARAQAKVEASRVAEKKVYTDGVAGIVARHAQMKTTVEDQTPARMESVADEVTEEERTEHGAAAEGKYEAQMSDPSTTPDPTAGPNIGKDERATPDPVAEAKAFSSISNDVSDATTGDDSGE